MSGYVYAIQAVDGGPVKIGWSENPEKRVGQLQTAHHSELRVVDSFKGSQAHESTLHDRLSDLGLRGEWFQDVPRLWDELSTMRFEVQREVIETKLNNTVIRAMTLAAATLTARMLDERCADRDMIASVFAELGDSFADAILESAAATAELRS